MSPNLLLLIAATLACLWAAHRAFAGDPADDRPVARPRPPWAVVALRVIAVVAAVACLYEAERWRAWEAAQAEAAERRAIAADRAKRGR